MDSDIGDKKLSGVSTSTTFTGHAVRKYYKYAKRRKTRVSQAKVIRGHAWFMRGLIFNVCSPSQNCTISLMHMDSALGDVT